MIHVTASEKNNGIVMMMVVTNFEAARDGKRLAKREDE
jgi:hypothetical protein